MVVVGNDGYLLEPRAIRHVDLTTAEVTTIHTDPSTFCAFENLTSDSVFLYFIQICSTSSSLKRLHIDNPSAVSTILVRSSVNAPRDVTVGPDGNLYVGTAFGELLRVDPVTGAETVVVADTGLLDYGSSRNIESVTGDADSIWYVVASANVQDDPHEIHQLLIFDASSALLDPPIDVVFYADELGLEALESAGDYLYGLKDFHVIRRWNKSTGAFVDVAGQINRRRLRRRDRHQRSLQPDQRHRNRRNQPMGPPTKTTTDSDLSKPPPETGSK